MSQKTAIVVARVLWRPHTWPRQTSVEDKYTAVTACLGIAMTTKEESTETLKLCLSENFYGSLRFEI